MHILFKNPSLEPLNMFFILFDLSLCCLFEIHLFGPEEVSLVIPCQPKKVVIVEINTT